MCSVFSLAAYNINLPARREKPYYIYLSKLNPSISTPSGFKVKGSRRINLMASLQDGPSQVIVDNSLLLS